MVPSSVLESPLFPSATEFFSIPPHWGCLCTYTGVGHLRVGRGPGDARWPSPLNLAWVTDQRISRKLWPLSIGKHICVPCTCTHLTAPALWSFQVETSALEESSTPG